MADFWNTTAPMLGIDPAVEKSAEDLPERDRLRAELDVLVARDLFGLTKDEMRYLLDPSDILGPDCGFETFGALKRAEGKQWNGRFHTRDLILDAWNRLPSPGADEVSTETA
jgi:hypothetical protein